MSVRKFAAAGVLGWGVVAILATGGCAPAHPATPANANFVQPWRTQPMPALLGAPPAAQAMQATPAPGAHAHALTNNDGERG